MPFPPPSPNRTTAEIRGIVALNTPDWTIASIEERLTLLMLAPETSATFELPVRLSKGHLNGLAQTIQLISTWSFVAPTPRTLRITDGSAEIGARNLPELDHLLIAAMFVDTIEDSRGNNITEEFREAAGDRLAHLDAADDLIDDRLMSVSHDVFDGVLSSRVHRDSKLGERVDLAAMDSVAQMLVLAATPARTSNDRESESESAERDERGPGTSDPDKVGDLRRRTARQAFTDLLFELMDNTHAHGQQRRVGRKSPDREMIDNSVRVLRAVRVLSPPDVLERTTDAKSPLGKYVARSLTKAGIDTGTSGLFEITFFDSGEGLGYWLAESDKDAIWDMPFAEEVRGTAASLLKSRGSRDRTYFPSGNGIYSAMEALSDLSGFVRVRTGRMSLFRDFADEPLRDSEGAPLFEYEPTLSFFRDWDSGTTEVSEKPRVRGTVYSVFLPLERLRSLG